MEENIESSDLASHNQDDAVSMQVQDIELEETSNTSHTRCLETEYSSEELKDYF